MWKIKLESSFNGDLSWSFGRELRKKERATARGGRPTILLLIFVIFVYLSIKNELVKI